VVFEFSRGARAEEFSATRIEQRHFIRPYVAPDWQLRVESLGGTRNLQWQLIDLGWVFSANRRTVAQIEKHNHRSLCRRPRSYPEPSRYRENEHSRRSQPNLGTAPFNCLLTELCEVLKARAAGAEVIQPTIRF